MVFDEGYSNSEATLNTIHGIYHATTGKGSACDSINLFIEWGLFLKHLCQYFVNGILGKRRFRLAHHHSVGNLVIFHRYLHNDGSTAPLKNRLIFLIARQRYEYFSTIPRNLAIFFICWPTTILQVYLNGLSNSRHHKPKS